MINKLYIGVIIVLMISNGLLYLSSHKKENEILKKQEQITLLMHENDVLNYNLESCKLVCEAEREAIKSLEEENEKLKDTETKTLEELRNALREETKKSGSDSIPVPIRGLLNNHCSNILGSPCPNP